MSLDSAFTPTKKRRGRPALKKNQPISNIGESTIQLKLNSTEESNASEQSEAIAKKGFQSTPMMKLSPTKDLKNRKDEPKGVLCELNTNYKSPSIRKKNKSNEIMFISENQSVLSSSPMSNIMASDNHILQSSPLNTSPLVRDKVFNYGNINNVMLQSSPVDHIVHSNDHYDEQFIKFINSSPVCISNTPKRNDILNISSPRSVKRNKIQNKLEHELTNNNGIDKDENINTSTSLKHRQKLDGKSVDLNNHRFNYRYKLTVNIDDYGEAKIFSRLLENKFISIDQLNQLYYEYSTRIAQGKIEDSKIQTPILNQQIKTTSLSKIQHTRGEEEEKLRLNIPNRYEEFINERRHLDNNKTNFLAKCMKNDAFMTNNSIYLPCREDQYNNSIRKSANLNHHNNDNIQGLKSIESSPLKRTFISAGIEGPVVLMEDMLDLDSLPNVPSNDALRALHEILGEK